LFKKEYPWSKERLPKNLLNLFEKLRPWFFLSDYNSPPNSNFLIADFFQFFFVWLQYTVFQTENNRTDDSNDTNNTNLPIIRIESSGGKNNELVYESEPYENNPFHDFVSETKTVLDKIKYVIYMYSYWIVLAIVFLTGTSRISILCLGYVIVSFFFLWYGQTFLMKPLNKLLRSWNFIVFYCYFVIFTKVCLQIVLCLIADEKIVCIITELFGIYCSSSVIPNCQGDSNKDSTDEGLIWDVICFFVLILQKRLYSSYMFEHVVNEYKSQSTLAARGAEIFKEIIYYKVEIERQKEKRTLEKLKENVERIRQHQSREWNQEPQEHFEAIRSGDYYMFDDEFEVNDTDVTDIDDDDDGKNLKNKSQKNSKRKKNKGMKELDKSEAKNEIDFEELENKKNRFIFENQTLVIITETIQKYFIIAFDYLIDYLNTHSRDFRHVSHILSKEKLILKKDFGNTQTPNIIALVSTTIELNEEQKKHHAALNKFLQDKNDKKSIIAAGEEIDNEINSQSRLNKFCISILYFMLSQTDKICYFFMILNHLQSASLLSAPLPIR
jgi:hypothetical protein